MSVVCFKESLHSHNGYDIHMIVTKPFQTQKKVCIILLHGTCSDMNEAGNAYVYLSRQLADHGYASIRFDFIGCGSSDVDIKVPLVTQMKSLNMRKSWVMMKSVY